VGATLLVAYLTMNEDTMGVDFDPFGGQSADTPFLTSDVVDKGPVIPQVQFTNNDISTAFQIISDATGWSIFPTELVSRAKVSLWAKDITAKDLLDTVVTLAGFIYHRQEGIISVMTYDEYMQYHGLVKKVIPLVYADAGSIAATIKPFLTKLGKSVIHRETNTIVLYEADANLESIAGIIAKLDMPAEGIGVEVINLKYADCESLAAILQQAFASQKRMAKNKNLGEADAGAPAPDKAAKQMETKITDIAAPYEDVGVYAVSHANQLIVVGTKSDIQKVKDVVAIVDVYGDNMLLEVIQLKYADAEVIGKALQDVFSRKDSQDSSKGAPKSKNPLGQPTQEQPPGPAAEVKGALFSPQAQVDVYSIGRTNQLIVKAFRSDVEKIRRLLKDLDIFIEPTTKNYHFTYVDAAEIYKGLDRILDTYGRYGRTSGQSGTVGDRAGYGRDSGITLVERTNSILLTGPPSVHRVMTSICESVDTPGTYEAGMIRVYKIENADVEEIAATVKALVETRAERERKPGEPKFAPPTEAAPAPAGPQMTETEEFVPQVEGKVSVNKATNSVVVQATARQHRELEKLIKELDVRRKQVLIRAMIVEVTSSNDLDFGVELDYFEGDLLAFTSFGLTKINPATGERSIIVSPGGTAAVLRPNRVQAIIKALQTNDNVRIQSTPQVLVNDNAVGTIQSIAEEPTRRVSQGETTTETSFGEYVSAGTQFAITPHISETDYLRVQYQITLNSFSEKADPELPPPRNTSTIQSEATVPDGYTIVVGGIQASNEGESIDKIPLLGDIPLVGVAFRNTVMRKQYITTYLFITTTIMRNVDFGDLKDVSKKALAEVEGNDGNKAKTRDGEAEDDE